jgi:hypothetical protein
MKNNYFFFILSGLALLLALGSIHSVSASSKYATIPNLCLAHNINGTSSYKLWLQDYYHLDLTEQVLIEFKDPLTSRPVRLPANYATLNGQGFEVAYDFENRGVHGSEDVLTFQTYPQDFSTLITVNILSDGSLSQTFNLSVSSNCNNFIVPVTSPIYVNSSSFISSGNISNLIKAYFPFNNDIKDGISGKSLEPFDTYLPVFQPGKFDQSLNVTRYASYVDDSSDTTKILNSLNSTNASVSFWYKDYMLTNNTNEYGIYLNCNNHFEFYQGYTSGNGWGNYITNPNGPPTDYVYVGNVDNNYHFVVISWNKTSMNVYADGSFLGNDLRYSFENISDCGIGDLSPYQSSYNSTASIDDLTFWKASLTASDVSSLYTRNISILSPYLPNSSNLIPDVYMSANQNYTLNFSQYYPSFKSAYVTVADPLSSFQYSLFPGSSTLNADYYELANFASYFILSSYARPYNYSVTAHICGTATYQDCISDVFNVFIGASTPSILELNPLQANYYLNGSTTFAGNYYYQYYDSLVLSIYDDNSTGAVNGSYNYFQYNTSSYLVYLPCNVSGADTIYNYTGNLNVSVECGKGQTYFSISANGNYNSKAYFTAINNVSIASGTTNLIGGNYQFKSGYIPTSQNSSIDALSNNVYIFGQLLPQNLPSGSQYKLVFLVLFVVCCLIFSIFYKSIVLALNLCYIAVMILMFFFFNQNYVTAFYPVLMLALYLAFWGYSIYKGNGS